jgi:lipoprotein-anchoring transpeptidase ErfK/SrfK
MFHLARKAVPVVLGAALTVAAAGPAAAFKSDRASWINYLQEQRAARQAQRPAPARPAARGFNAPETGVVRPGVQHVVQRRPSARPAAPQTNVRRASLPRVSRQMDPRFMPQTVAYDGPHKPGTIVIDTSDRFLYLVGANGTAKRYGVGVGRQGFQWTGRHRITMKREWPGWTPPPAMRRREPDLPAFMPGGPDNPLGARALYLGSTLYRIHGSNAPWTIGHAVSSGCIRMRNEDVIDLYQRVGVGTMVVVQR